MFNLQYEISRELPQDAQARTFAGGIPILYAFGCALLERETGTGFVYTAVNLTTNKSEVLARRLSPLSSCEVERMGNQQPRPEKGKVQRLSRKGVRPSGPKMSAPSFMAGEDIVCAHMKVWDVRFYGGTAPFSAPA